MYNKKSTGANLGLCIVGLLIVFNLFALGMIGKITTILFASLMTALLYVVFVYDGKSN